MIKLSDIDQKYLNYHNKWVILRKKISALESSPVTQVWISINVLKYIVENIKRKGIIAHICLFGTPEQATADRLSILNMVIHKNVHFLEKMALARQCHLKLAWCLECVNILWKIAYLIACSVHWNMDIRYVDLEPT